MTTLSPTPHPWSTSNMPDQFKYLDSSLWEVALEAANEAYVPPTADNEAEAIQAGLDAANAQAIKMKLPARRGRQTERTAF